MNIVTTADLLSAFVNSMEDHAVVLLNVEGLIQTWNTGARRIFGYELNEVLGRPFSLLYRKSESETSRPAASLKDAIAQGRHEETGRRVRKDGTEFATQSVILPLRDDNDGLIG